MLRKILLAITLVVIVAIAFGYVGLTALNNNQPTPSATPQPSPTSNFSPTPQISPSAQTSPTTSPISEPASEEKIRDAVINYIRTRHSQAAPYMQEFMWTGGMMPQGMMVGSSTYSYQSNGWNVTMQYPITLNPIYTIAVNYTSPISEMFPPQNMITWSGTWQNGTITETNYSFTP
jgi:hypothetical protein